MAGSNIDDQIMNSTNISKNPDIPNPIKIVGATIVESGVIESPLSTGNELQVPTESPSKVPSIKLRDITSSGSRGCPIKRSIHITEADNGYIVSMDGGSFHKSFVFNSLGKMSSAIQVFLRIDLSEKSGE